MSLFDRVAVALHYGTVEIDLILGCGKMADYENNYLVNMFQLFISFLLYLICISGNYRHWFEQVKWCNSIS